ncbi:hypothetical protein JCM10213v2_008252 [Rhodosporidiobolus nylandii]
MAATPAGTRHSAIHRVLCLSSSTPTSSLVALLSHSALSISYLVFINAASPFVLSTLLSVPPDRTGALTGRLLLADEMTAMAVYLPAGAAADKWGVKRAALAGHVVAAGALVAYVNQSTVGGLIAARAVFAVGAGTLVTTLSSMLSVVSSCLPSSFSPSGRPSGCPRSRPPAQAADEQTSLLADEAADGYPVVDVFGFLRLPTLLSRDLPHVFPSLSSSALAELSLKYAFYTVALLALAETALLGCLLPTPARRREREERVKSVAQRVGDSVKGLFEGFRLAKVEGEVALGYLSSFASRAQAVIVTAYIPLLVNRYLSSHDLCSPSAASLLSSTAGQSCRQAYILSSILTGSIQLLSLLLSPVIGYLSTCPLACPSSSPRSAPALALFLSFALGALSFAGFASLPDGDPRAPVAWAYVVGIGAAQAAGVVLSLALVSSGAARLKQLARSEGKEEEGMEGRLGGSYALSGGLGILLLAPPAGWLFDRVSLGAPFALMGVVELFVAGAAGVVWWRSGRTQGRRVEEA